MNYQPYGIDRANNYNIAVGDQGERVIPLLTGFALGAPFWGSLGASRPQFGGPVFFPPYRFPFAYPFPYQYRFPRRHRRWY